MCILTNIIILQLVQNLQNLDIGILRSVFENRNPALDPVFLAITNTAAALAFGIPCILLFNALLKKNIVLRRNALLLLIPVAISAIVANILKYAIDLPRPYEVYSFIHKLSVGGSPTFPSGHTADAFAFATIAGLVYRRWFIIIPCIIWASLVGYSRMALGVHFPTDVLGGALVGILCSSSYYLFIKIKRQRNDLPEQV